MPTVTLRAPDGSVLVNKSVDQATANKVASIANLTSNEALLSRLEGRPLSKENARKIRCPLAAVDAGRTETRCLSLPGLREQATTTRTPSQAFRDASSIALQNIERQDALRHLPQCSAWP